VVVWVLGLWRLLLLLSRSWLKLPALPCALTMPLPGLDHRPLVLLVLILVLPPMPRAVRGGGGRGEAIRITILYIQCYVI
jgi:hypothetical protein